MFNPAAYTFNLVTLPNILVGILIFATGCFVFSQDRTNKTHRSFFCLCAMIAIWLFGRVFMYSTDDPVIALAIGRKIAFFGVVLISPLTYFFSVHWLDLYEKQKKIYLAAVPIAAILYVLTAFTSWGITSVEKYFWGFYPVYGIVCKLYLVYFSFYFLLAFYNFFTAIKLTSDANRKKQIALINVAFMIAFLGSIDYLPKLGYFPIYPFGYGCVLIWILVIAYTIVKYRALDIQTVVHKTIMWFLASSVLGVPLVTFYYVQKQWVYELPAVPFIALISTSFIIVVLYTRHVQPRIDHFFQRRQWDLTRAMERFNDGLVELIRIEDVTAHILHTVRNLFYVTNVSFLYRSEKNKAFQFVQRHSFLDPDLQVSMNNEFLRWLEENDSIVFEEYMGLDPRLEIISKKGQEYFESVKGYICVPMVVNHRLIGILNLGQKQSLRRFSPAEVSFLNDFRRSAAIALSNAIHLIAIQENLRHWNEELEKKVDERTNQLKNTQAQLVQAEKLATIGTLAGGVAHEINNPLTAVLTNAQILKMDASEEDVESIELIEEGAKRCQFIIQNLLKYARKPQAEETYAEVDIRQVIKNVSSLLEYQLMQDNIKLVLDFKEVSKVRGISNEYEQVITNLIVNARDAIRAKTKNGTIQIKAYEDSDYVFVEVIDNGGGMPEEVMKKVFDPFFTTKEVGGGTGLGLAVSYSIVEKFLGAIDVKSEADVGTTFTLKFPASSEAKKVEIPDEG